jgi:hypothetical protein
MKKSEKTNHPKNIHNLDLVLVSCLILSLLSSFSIYNSPQAYDVAAQQQLNTTSQTAPNLVLPKVLSVTDIKMGDTQLPLRASIINEKSDGELTELKEGQGEGKLSEFFPIVTFRLDTQSNGFEDVMPSVENVLIGPIKSYDSLDGILEEVNYWKNVPLEESVALEIDHPGKHYFIVSVKFENGTSGIYSGVMDVNAIGLKPSSSESIQFKLDSADISSGAVRIDQVDMKTSKLDSVFQQLAYKIICSDLSANGFEVCAEEDMVVEEGEDSTNDDSSKDDGEDDGSGDDVEVRGDGGRGGIYDVDNCTGEQCEDADKETAEEEESDDCEINPSICDGNDGEGKDSDESNEQNDEDEEPENADTTDA